jgi:hypothetical protein
MKYFPIILICLVFTACKTDTSNGNDPAPADVQSQSADAPQPLSAHTLQPKKEPVTESEGPSGSVATVGTLTLAAQNIEGRKGQIACMDVTVADFRNVISMQYSIQWDAKVLKYSNVHGFQLPFLSAQNFGVHRINEGILTFVWIDNTLQGKDLPDGSSIYQVCFDVIGDAGQQSHFIITDQPTPFESVNAQEKLLQISTVDGSVRIK